MGHLGAGETSCEHIIDIIIFPGDIANLLTNTYLHIQQLWSNIIIHLELLLVTWPMPKSNIRSLLALFLVSTNSWGKSLSLYLLNAPLCSPVSLCNCVCLQFHAEQVVYSGFSELFLWKRCLLQRYEKSESESKK